MPSGSPGHGTTGKEALNRIDELALLLQRTGVNKPGDAEQMAYILQNQLSPEELSRWTALANSDPTISDAGLNVLELGTTNAPAGRHSCTPLTREAFFAGRTDHLRNFLRDLGVSGGSRHGGPAARAAVSNGTTDDAPYVPPVSSGGLTVAHGTVLRPSTTRRMLSGARRSSTLGRPQGSASAVTSMVSSFPTSHIGSASFMASMPRLQARLGECPALARQTSVKASTGHTVAEETGPGPSPPPPYRS